MMGTAFLCGCGHAWALHDIYEPSDPRELCCVAMTQETIRIDYTMPPTKPAGLYENTDMLASATPRSQHFAQGRPHRIS